MDFEEQPSDSPKPEEQSGCSTLFILIVVGLFIFGFIDRTYNPPKAGCAYSVDLC